MPVLYWDTPGNWNITVLGNDISGGNSTNTTVWFQVQDTTALTVHPNELTFPSSTPGATSVMSDNDPLKVNNTANHNITVGNVRVTAINLIGYSDSGYIIPAANFTANITDVCGPGTNLVNGSAQGITGSILPPGNISTGVATEDLYFCIKQVPPGISQQAYDTRKGGSWIISVV
jgi:flagellar hook-associated protein FlgK